MNAQPAARGTKRLFVEAVNAQSKVKIVQTTSSVKPQQTLVAIRMVKPAVMTHIAQPTEQRAVKTVITLRIENTVARVEFVWTVIPQHAEP